MIVLDPVQNDLDCAIVKRIVDGNLHQAVDCFISLDDTNGQSFSLGGGRVGRALLVGSWLIVLGYYAERWLSVLDGLLQFSLAHFFTVQLPPTDRLFAIL
jgi:hypothetical protein